MAHRKDQPYPFLGQQAILYLWGGHREMQMSGLKPCYPSHYKISTQNTYTLYGKQSLKISDTFSVD